MFQYLSDFPAFPSRPTTTSTTELPLLSPSLNAVQLRQSTLDKLEQETFPSACNRSTTQHDEFQFQSSSSTHRHHVASSTRSTAASEGSSSANDLPIWSNSTSTGDPSHKAPHNIEEDAPTIPRAASLSCTGGSDAVTVQLPPAKDAILLESIPVKDPALRPSLLTMLPDIRALSFQCFDEDVTQLINKKTGWKMNLLVTPGETRLLGFLSYRIRGQPPSSVLEVAKLAIMNDCRHLGYGRRLIKAVLSSAKKLPNVDYVGLSSLAEAVTFYQKLGFKRHDDVKFSHTLMNGNEEITPGQVYMEMKIRNSNSRCKGNNAGQKKKKK